MNMSNILSLFICLRFIWPRVEWCHLLDINILFVMHLMTKFALNII